MCPACGRDEDCNHQTPRKLGGRHFALSNGHTMWDCATKRPPRPAAVFFVWDEGYSPACEVSSHPSAEHVGNSRERGLIPTRSRAGGILRQNPRRTSRWPRHACCLGEGSNDASHTERLICEEIILGSSLCAGRACHRPGSTAAASPAAPLGIGTARSRSRDVEHPRVHRVHHRRPHHRAQLAPWSPA